MRYDLPADQMPTAWFNAVPGLPEPMQPPLHPGNAEPIGPDDLAPLFPMGLIAQEVSTEPWIDIPGEVLDILRLWRPTPLVRAERLEQRSARRRGSTSRTSRCRRPARTSRTPPCRRRSTTQPRASAAHDRDRRRPVGHGAGVRLRPVRPRVQGLHGAGVVRAEALPQGPDGDVGRRGRAVTRRPTRPSRLAGSRDQRCRA